ncbi:MAG TPA: C39 family peptidase [Candidatus Manganitrophaceae bacterium]|nr:C39 family peptidase [Candidatus Manganitrophaceae bacterium]
MISLRQLLFIPMFLLIACSQAMRVPPSDRAGEGKLLLDVPFFPQPEGLCGPASLASVLHFWKRTTSVEEIKEAIYLPRLNGTLGIDLTHFARKEGFLADSFTGTLPALRERLAEGIPLIAFLNLGNRLFPVGHFIVVTGIDERREEVIAHSGSEPNKPIPYQTFLAAWKKTDYWTLQIVPPHGG